MEIARCFLSSISAYSQSKAHFTEKNDKEIPKDYEERTWKERLHVDENEMVFIPPMAVKNCLSECAKFLSIQIPGKGKATYTKHFEAGILIQDPIPLNIKKADVEGEWLFVPSDGKRGGGKRVAKCFPIIPQWSGEINIYILDPTITKDVFEEHLKEAGNFIGIGRFRPRNNGYYGRFKVDKVEWSNH